MGPELPQSVTGLQPGVNGFNPVQQSASKAAINQQAQQIAQQQRNPQQGEMPEPDPAVAELEGVRQEMLALTAKNEQDMAAKSWEVHGLQSQLQQVTTKAQQDVVQSRNEAQQKQQQQSMDSTAKFQKQQQDTEFKFQSKMQQQEMKHAQSQAKLQEQLQQSNQQLQQLKAEHAVKATASSTPATGTRALSRVQEHMASLTGPKHLSKKAASVPAGTAAAPAAGTRKPAGPRALQNINEQKGSALHVPAMAPERVSYTSIIPGSVGETAEKMMLPMLNKYRNDTRTNVTPLSGTMKSMAYSANQQAARARAMEAQTWPGAMRQGGVDAATSLLKSFTR